MDCPNCKTWNPDDKVVCWRCQAELPKPKPQKKKKLSGGFSPWMWVLVVVVFSATLLAQCLFMPNVIPGQ